MSYFHEMVAKDPEYLEIALKDERFKDLVSFFDSSKGYHVNAYKDLS